MSSRVVGALVIWNVRPRSSSLGLLLGRAVRIRGLSFGRQNRRPNEAIEKRVGQDDAAITEE